MITESRLPRDVLGVGLEATPDEIRAAYLGLVRQFPPDREPERFREVHAAYTALSDPLVQAEAFVSRTAIVRPDLAEVINLAEKRLARIPKLPLLALGNLE